MFSRINFQKKRRKFGYYFSLPSFRFLEEKPQDFICASLLKPDTHLPKNCFICFNESPLRMMENAFNPFHANDLFRYP